MIKANVRKQGGAAIMTIPPAVVKLLNLKVGSTLSLKVTANAFVAEPIGTLDKKKRYSLAELLSGATPEVLSELKEKTQWVDEGSPIGRELV